MHNLYTFRVGFYVHIGYLIPRFTTVARRCGQLLATIYNNYFLQQLCTTIYNYSRTPSC